MKINITSEIKTIKYEKDDFFIFSIIKPEELKYESKLRTRYNNHLIYIKGKSKFSLKIGDTVTIMGDLSINDFNKEPVVLAKKIEKQFIVTETGFINFLKTFKGLGNKTISKIVELYKLDIKNAKKNFIKDVNNNNKNIVSILKVKLHLKIKEQLSKISEETIDESEKEFIQEFDIPPGLVKKIKEQNKNIIKVFEENPYELALFTKGIGFKTIDKTASKIKNKLKIPDKKFRLTRLSMAVFYTLTESEKDGHTFLRKQGIFYFLKELNIEDYELIEENFQDIIDYLQEKKIIIIEDDKYYLYFNYKVETKTAKIIAKKYKLEKTNIKLKQFEFEKGFTPSPKQEEALKMALVENIMILTGGPGTGKTTIAKYIYINMRKYFPNKKIKIMAPTGTAARRISQVIGCEATTIHRAIKYNGIKALYNDDKKLNADIVIVDESSMIDLKLLKLLLSAIKLEAKIIFIGDVEQLPSVGIGNCLEDMENAKIPTVRLDRVYRQNNDNPIVDFAYDVNKKIINYYPYLTKEYNDNKKLNVIIKNSFQKKYNENYMINMENETIDNFIYFYEEKGYSLLDIQILTQLRKGNIGTTNSINKKIQNYINKNNFIPNTIFKIGDKIIQTRNNKKKEIFNGSMGFVKSYNEKTKEITIDFIDGNETIQVIYSSENKSIDENIKYNLDLAYSITIHKSQGNEWKVVILNLNNYFYINKKLLYTGITRAREKGIIITNHVNLRHGIETEYGLKEINEKLVQVKRNSMLKERILKEIENYF